MPKKSPSKLRIFVKGFLKGLKVLFSFFLVNIIYCLIIYILFNISNVSSDEALNESIDFLNRDSQIVAQWFVQITLIFYFIRKYKQPYFWIIPGFLFIGIFTIPIILGNAELESNK